MNLYALAREVTEEMGGESVKWTLGMHITHPDGYEVEIINGQYWGTYGLSNFWCWKRLDTDEEECGYGWQDFRRG